MILTRNHLSCPIMNKKAAPNDRATHLHFVHSQHGQSTICFIANGDYLLYDRQSDSGHFAVALFFKIVRYLLTFIQTVQA